jgi:hypothetical protein
VRAALSRQSGRLDGELQPGIDRAGPGVSGRAGGTRRACWGGVASRVGSPGTRPAGPGSRRVATGGARAMMAWQRAAAPAVAARNRGGWGAAQPRGAGCVGRPRRRRGATRGRQGVSPGGRAASQRRSIQPSPAATRGRDRASRWPATLRLAAGRGRGGRWRFRVDRPARLPGRMRRLDGGSPRCPGRPVNIRARPRWPARQPVVSLPSPDPGCGQRRREGWAVRLAPLGQAKASPLASHTGAPAGQARLSRNGLAQHGPLNRQRLARGLAGQAAGARAAQAVERAGAPVTRRSA